MAEKFDAIIVGAGQAGPFLEGSLTDAGYTVAVIERHLLGGTCVNNGCIPTKTLIASAHAAHLATRGADYGFGAGRIRVDMKAIKRRKDQVVRHSSDALKKWIGGMKHVTLIHGQARFSGPH